MVEMERGVGIVATPSVDLPPSSRSQGVSTMEVEYVATCEATKDDVWLSKFLTDLEVVPNLDKPITLYCDNNGVMANSREPRSHKRGKYIERKYHLIRKIM